MSAQPPLTGPVLVSCAKANVTAGVETAAQNCGYGDNVKSFKTELNRACSDMGVEIEEFSDLLTDQQQVKCEGGLEVAPETPADL